MAMPITRIATENLLTNKSPPSSEQSVPFAAVALMNDEGLILLLHALQKPPHILPRSRNNRHNHEFRHIIAVQLVHFLLQLSQSPCRCLDHHQHFSPDLNLSLP